MSVEYPGAVYPEMARGNNGQEIFRTDRLRVRFLETLGEACTQMGWVIHAYVLIIHLDPLLLGTMEANLVRG